MTADATAELQFTERDLKELGRLAKKYGPKRVAAKLKNIPLPAMPGRPKKRPEELNESQEFNEEMAEAIYTWSAEYKRAKRTNPVELAFKDLYELLHPKPDPDYPSKYPPRHRPPYKNWRKTNTRKLGPVRRYVDARLIKAEQSAARIAAYVAKIKKESAK
jgi:hypothetical protein